MRLEAKIGLLFTLALPYNAFLLHHAPGYIFHIGTWGLTLLMVIALCLYEIAKKKSTAKSDENSVVQD